MRLLLVTLIGALALPAFSQTVLVVDAAGTGDYTTVQAAIDAAIDGDVVVVRRTATFLQPAVIHGKDVDLVGLPDALGRPPEIAELRILDAPAGSQIVVRGLTFGDVSGSWPTRYPVSLTDCAGQVWIEDCAAGTVDALNVDSLHLEDMETLTYNDWEPTHGLTLTDSSAVVRGSTLRGTWGYLGNDNLFCSSCSYPGGPGYDGAQILGSTFAWMETSELTGGAGGFTGPCSSCLDAPNGRPVTVESTATLEVRNVALDQFDGPAGAVTTLTDRPRAFHAPASVRQRSSATFTIEGEHGEVLYLLVGREGVTVPLGGEAGVLEVGDAVSRRRVGTIPASGQLTFQIPAPAVPPGQAETFLIQPAVLTPLGVRLSPARVIHVVGDGPPLW